MKVLSSDKKTIEIGEEVLKYSKTLQHLLEDVGGAKDSATVIPLPNIRGVVVEEIVKFCKYHAEHPLEESKYIKGGRVDDFAAWDKEFTDNLKGDQWLLFETIQAASYLEIKSLLEVTCRTVAGMIKGKSPDQVCDLFSKNKQTNAHIFFGGQLFLFCL